MCWSPNNKKLAIVSTDRVISFFDDSGEMRDKFGAKPGDPKVCYLELILQVIVNNSHYPLSKITLKNINGTDMNQITLLNNKTCGAIKRLTL